LSAARLHREVRLRSRADFARVFKEGRRLRSPSLMLAAIPNGLAWSRFAVSASRRIGNSVVRNRTKRCLKEAFRLQQGEIRAGLDLVAVPRDGLAGESLRRAIDLLLPVLRRAERAFAREASQNP